MTKMRCNSFEEGISVPFSGDVSSKEQCAGWDKSITRGYKISLSSIDSDLDFEDKSSNGTQNGTGYSSDSFKKSKYIAVPEDSSRLSTGNSSNSRPCSKDSRTLSGDSVDDKEGVQLMYVQQQRFRLAKIIPSLAEQIKLEGKNYQQERTSCQIQENIIGHLTRFIEQKALPAILGLEDLHKQFERQTIKSQQQIEFLGKENLSLEAKIKSSDDANIQKEKNSVISKLLTGKRWSMTNTDASTSGSDLDLNQGGSKDQQNMMVIVKKWLDASKKEHDIGKEQMMNVVRTLQKRVNQLELEIDLIEGKKRIFEDKTLKTQIEQHQIRKDNRPESFTLETPECKKKPQGSESPEVIQVSKEDLFYKYYHKIPQMAIKHTKKVSIGSKKRAFQRTASKAEKQHRYNCVHNDSTFLDVQRVAQLDKFQKKNDIISLRADSVVI